MNYGILGNINGLGDIILILFSLIVIFGGVFGIIFILYGGLLLILSGGDKLKIKEAFNCIRYSIIGIILIVLTIFIFPILGSFLGLNVSHFADSINIFNKIEEIGKYIF